MARGEEEEAVEGVDRPRRRRDDLGDEEGLAE
jgi:hypothetical protein